MENFIFCAVSFMTFHLEGFDFMPTTVCIIYVISIITLSVKKIKICFLGQLQVSLHKNTKQEKI